MRSTAGARAQTMKEEAVRFLVCAGEGEAVGLKVFHIGMSHNGISEYPKITCHIEITNCIDISS